MSDIKKAANRVQRVRAGESTTAVYGIHGDADFANDCEKLAHAYIDAVLRLNSCCTKDDLAGAGKCIVRQFERGER